MAITASFVPGTGVLTATGDGLDNAITASRDAAGNILVNGGAVPILGGTPTVANTSLTVVSGLGGNDVISLDEVNGVLPAAQLLGGDGNDTLTGGSGGDQLFGQAGNDTLLGKGGTDVLQGGDGDDVLTGGDGDDQIFGEAGNDRIIWNPGDDSDLAEGGAGIDTVEVNGGNGAENFTITANGARVRVDRVDPAPFFVDAGTIENIVINANGGDDVISAANGLLALTSLTIDGGAGNDTLVGSQGNDALLGGDGNDTLNGVAGNDVVNGGAGNDRIVWNIGDGSDVAEGGDDIDTLEVNGNNAAQTFTVTVNGARVHVDSGPFNVDAGTIEAVTINAGGGDDVVSAAGLGTIATLTIDGGAGNDTITGSASNDVLFGAEGNDIVTGGQGSDAALLGAGNDVFIWNPGDGSDIVEGGADVDLLEFNGANVNENIDISANGGRVRFFRDVANVTMDVNDTEVITFHAFGGADNIVVNDVSGTDLPLGGVLLNLESALGSGVGDGQVDTVTVNGTAGNDPINIKSLNGDIAITGASAPVVIFHSEATDRLVINGGAGGDVIDASGLNAGQIGLTLNLGLGGDVFIGSQGNDVVIGGDGNDAGFLGAGNDVFIWNPGDDNDVIEGGAGTDALQFNGANVNEIIDISANGDRVRLSRDVANVTMDMNDVEVITLRTFGGADNITVNDVTGSDLKLGAVLVDLEAALGSGTGDGQVDRVTVNGTAGNDTINVVSANGAIQVGGGAANVTLFHAEATDQLVVNGGGGNDAINASALPAGTMGLTLGGEAGNDTLIGSHGNDFLFGGDGNDTLTGGDGDDQMFGEAGDDRMIWNPGDDTDLVEGGDGTDTAEVNGGNGAESFTATANGARVRFDRVTPAPFSLDIGTTENLVLNMNGGDDSFSATGNLAALIKLTVDGGAGNDTILGGNGDDLLLGGDGNDFVDGNQGNDTALLGAGDDVFQWDPGDGSDVVEGQDGLDTLLFNGANIAEIFDVSANGGRARFTRNVGNIVMDLNDVERIDVNALGGTDTITVNDLSGTDVAQVNINLAGTLGGSAGDALADTVIVNGRNGDDVVDVIGAGTSVSVVGLPALVNIAQSEGANDALVINTLGGNDVISANTLMAGITKLTVDAGAGNDIFFGSRGADTFLGGDGNDFIDGNQGDDVGLLGDGNDVFQWDPGDGNDTVEGQAGVDQLVFNGANISENIDILANGGRVRFFRDVANVTMDVNDTEVITFHAFGGADNIVVNDVSGTDLPLGGVLLNLESALGSGVGDGQVDTVTVNGTAGNDPINIKSLNGDIAITGASAPVVIFHSEATDRLVINGGAGGDVIDASGLNAGQVGLTLNLGAGGDVFFGSQGNDVVIGGTGNDAGFLGAGNDVFIWNPGDGSDVIEGGPGTDTLLFNGANIAETFTISANGERVLFTRDIGNVTMDVNDVELVDLHALGGADTIVVNDLTGTDLPLAGVRIDLASTLGVADGALDSVTLNGSAAGDAIHVTSFNGGVLVSGTPAAVGIFHADATDQLIVNGGAGGDVIDASTLAAGQINLTFNLGLGGDVFFGSQGNDVVIGGDGNDAGFLGAGNDVFIWNPGDDNDVVEGGSGIDTLLFNGANIGESVSISANGERVRFSRDVANVTMDVNDTEVVDFHALGGADTITVNDLSGTDVNNVRIDLSAAGGGGDGQVDTIVINATNGSDAITVSNNNGVVTVSGLAAQVTISGFEATDRIVINGVAGDDVIDASGLGTAMLFTADGGNGDDVLIGSDGPDTLLGGAGDDVLLGGLGLDVLDGGPGDNVLIQGISAPLDPLII